MNAATERKILRWVHLILSIPILGFIDGPVATMPTAALTVKIGFVPAVIVSGLWMWLAPKIRAANKKRQASRGRDNSYVKKSAS